MAEAKSGLFTIQEFQFRKNVLKLAPDAFVQLNGAFKNRILSPLQATGDQDIDIRGGVTNINVSAAISPPGASRATIEVIAPQYKGLHEDYYITLPNGVRVPVFIPMTEIRIFMKGRYLEESKGYAPQYYPVFWGMITGVQENYANGVYTFTLTCEDFLVWWKFQQINLTPSAITNLFGGAFKNRFPSAFTNLSAWEIIYALFLDTFFMDEDQNGVPRFFNFLYPHLSQTNVEPASKYPLKDTFGPLARNVVQYWNARFGFGIELGASPEEIQAQISNIPLEMFGLKGQLGSDVIRDVVTQFLDPNQQSMNDVKRQKGKLPIDFSLLARIQPYGTYDLYGSGSEDQVKSKLEIATEVCDKTQMEFFVDTNGTFVFKPPFYNLDVASRGLPYYRVAPDDVINFNTNFESNNIINFMVVTGQWYSEITSLQPIGLHVDFESIKKFGIRSDKMHVLYGKNADQLKMIAVAEMAKRNGLVYTGSVSVPLRPEIRMGYPVYIEHIDTYYYVTGLTHSFTYGSAATTDLSLQFKRDRIFDDGTSGIKGSEQGSVLAGCVLRDREEELVQEIKEYRELQKKSTMSLGDFQKIKNRLEDEAREGNINESNQNLQDDLNKYEQYINETKKRAAQKEKGIYSGPGVLGYYKIDKARENTKKMEEIKNKGEEEATISNELLIITNETIPFTDIKGYRHIGALPYGANLILQPDGSTVDKTAAGTSTEVSAQINATGETSESRRAMDLTASRQATGELASDQSEVDPTLDAERRRNVLASLDLTELERLRRDKKLKKNMLNEEAKPEYFTKLESSKKGTARAKAINTATSIQVNIDYSSPDICKVETRKVTPESVE